MHRVGTWLHPRRLNASASTQSLDSLVERQNLEAAMHAAIMILNDDVDGAEEGLGSGNSSFHLLGRGVVTFLRATLGFEHDVMKEASDRLTDAEATATNDYNKAQRDDQAYHSSIYLAGSEFSLVIAMSQMMSAVVAVLSESLTESIKGFYKLRKAFVTLNALVEMEEKFMTNNHRLSVVESDAHSSEIFSHNKPNDSSSNFPNGTLGSSLSVAGTGGASSAPVSPTALSRASAMTCQDDEASEGEDDFYDADESHDSVEALEQYNGHIFGGLQRGRSFTPEVISPHISKPPFSAPPVSDLKDLNHEIQNGSVTLDTDPRSTIFTSPVDSFIHSGANSCLGTLQVLLSIIPPSFGRLLSIIGFRGDRERGLRLLWQASKFHNINGGMAGLTLLGWYNGITGFCDIVPDSNENTDDVEGYPLHRLKNLLSLQRSRYPRSLLWLLEDARMEAAQRRLSNSIKLLSQPASSPLKQVQALYVFEKSLNCMYAHRYELCAESFIKCVELNSWSPALYYYVAGAAYLTLYRQNKHQNRKFAEEYAAKAEKYLKTAPTQTGKKKMLGRQLPLDQFVNRKLTKWIARAEEWNCDLVDAVGVNPLEEMIFLWGGHKRMNGSELGESLSNIEWSVAEEQTTHGTKSDLDERAISAILRAAVFRNLRRHEEAKALLQNEILVHERHQFKGHLKDDWTCPIAHYEMGVNLWMQRTGYIQRYGAHLSSDSPVRGEKPEAAKQGLIEEDLKKDQELVAEAKQWIEKVSHWESFELDQRFGMRITVALDSIRKWEASHKTQVAGAK